MCDVCTQPCSHVRPGGIWAHGAVGASRPTEEAPFLCRDPLRPSPSVTSLFFKPCDLCLAWSLAHNRQFTDV